ncbi:N-acetylglucosamine-6-phosphate deacetylase [candidate division KSB1 bacterium]
MKNYIVKNGRVILRDRILTDTIIVVENGKIKEITTDSQNQPDYKIIDAQGHYVSPAFVELHIHGCEDFSIESGEEDILEKICGFLQKRGINTFVPSIQCKENILAITAAELKSKKFLQEFIPGIYVEGPFVNPKKRGGILPEFVKAVDLDYLEKLIEISHDFIKMMTAAPELEGSRELIESLLKENIIPCYGHSDCELKDIHKFKGSSRFNITHLFNAMSTIDHKRSGLAMLPFIDREIFFELNCDGVHLSPEIIKLCYENLNHERMILISDAVISAGKAHGCYKYYEKEVISDGNGVRYKDNNILIGANCLVNDVMKKFIGFTGAPIEKAVQFVTYNPCKLLGIENKKGSIKTGKDADLIIFDDEFNIIRNLGGYQDE